MRKLENLKPQAVFKYFEDIASIPHGSGNTGPIRDYCVNFAKEHGLRYHTDELNNVVIYKEGSAGYENSPAVILQAHTDMVCQKTDDCTIDFEKDGLDLFVDGDLIGAKGTTLGADDGIGMAIILAVLADNTLSNPPLECVFTSDEEVGMYGAHALDMSKLSAKKMINIDGGGQNSALISCAGGASFEAEFDYERAEKKGTVLKINLGGLPGGHSGGQINKGFANANALMIKILNDVYSKESFEIISINGGNKTNVITPSCEAYVACENPDILISALENMANDVKKKIEQNNPHMEFSVCKEENCNCKAIVNTGDFLNMASNLPSGVLVMSDLMENYVQTSANFAILRSSENSSVTLVISVRSCVKDDLQRVLYELNDLCTSYGAKCSVSGEYPPWQFKKDTELQKIFDSACLSKTGTGAKITATHAGLECGIFDTAIDDLDCISVGPIKFDIHSPSERLSISSTQVFYEIITEVLKNCK